MNQINHCPYCRSEDITDHGNRTPENGGVLSVIEEMDDHTTEVYAEINVFRCDSCDEQFLVS